jgi:hypothetical protein
MAICRSAFIASLDELLDRFGDGTPQRQLVTARLLRVHELASGTGKLERFIIFGSYVTAKPDPNDVDIILVMRDDFREQENDEETAPVFIICEPSLNWVLASSGRRHAVFCLRPLISSSSIGKSNEIIAGTALLRLLRRNGDDSKRR